MFCKLVERITASLLAIELGHSVESLFVRVAQLAHLSCRCVLLDKVNLVRLREGLGLDLGDWSLTHDGADHLFEVTSLLLLDEGPGIAVLARTCSSAHTMHVLGRIDGSIVRDHMFNRRQVDTTGNEIRTYQPVETESGVSVPNAQGVRHGTESQTYRSISPLPN